MYLDDIFVKTHNFTNILLVKATTSISVYLIQYIDEYCFSFFTDVLQITI